MKLNRAYRRPSELPTTIPIFPLAGALLLPRRPLQLSIFEPRYLAMVDDALAGERLIGIIQPTDGGRRPSPRRNSARSAAPAASSNSPRPATAAASSR